MDSIPVRYIVLLYEVMNNWLLTTVAKKNYNNIEILNNNLLLNEK